MELVPYWKQAWKLSTVIIAALLAIFAGLQASLPDLQKYLSPEVFAIITSVISVGLIIARVVKQTIPVPVEVQKEMVINAKATPVTEPVKEPLT